MASCSKAAEKEQSPQSQTVLSNPELCCLASRPKKKEEKFLDRPALLHEVAMSYSGQKVISMGFY